MNWISIDGQTYDSAENQIILNLLRSQPVQALDKVGFACQEMGKETDIHR